MAKSRRDAADLEQARGADQTVVQSSNQSNASVGGRVAVVTRGKFPRYEERVFAVYRCANQAEAMAIHLRTYKCDCWSESARVDDHPGKLRRAK